MNNQRWFYELLMEEFGPTSAADLLQLIQDRTLGQSDRVRPESSASWITVAEFLDTFAADAESSTDDDTDDDRHAELDINSFNLQGDGTPKQEPELNIDSFNLQGDSDSPKPASTRNRRPPVIEEPEEEDEATYYVRSLGLELGPLTQDEIVDMAKSGSFSRGDEIREGSEGDWIAIESLTGQMEQRSSESPASEDVENEPADETEVDSIAGTPSAKPGKKSVRKKAAGSKAQRPAAPKRKKRKAKKDEFLQEIFAELFNEDGKLRDDRKPEAPAAAAAAGGVTQGSSETAGGSFSQTGGPASSAAAAGMTAGAASGYGQAMGAAAGMNSSPVPGMRATPGAAGTPSQFTPPAPQFRPSKPSRGGGGGFAMPEPKVLGIIGGALLVVLLIVGGFMGYLPTSLGTPSAADFLKEFAAAHAQASAGPESAWNELETKFGDRARAMARALAPHASKNPKTKHELNASLYIAKLIAIPFDKADERKEAYAQFTKAAAGR